MDGQWHGASFRCYIGTLNYYLSRGQVAAVWRDACKRIAHE
jgi:hypothetical protein